MEYLQLLKALIVAANWKDDHFQCVLCHNSLATNFHSDNCLLVIARNQGVDIPDIYASGDFGDEGEPKNKWGKKFHDKADRERGVNQ